MSDYSVRHRVTVFPMTGRQMRFLYVPHGVCEECDLTARLVRCVADETPDIEVRVRP